MASTSEFGHEKVVANFDVIISCAQGIGKDYLPAKALLKIDSLLNIDMNCKKAVDAVRESNAAYKTAVDDRAAAFARLSKLTTRVSSTLEASEVSPETIVTAKSMIRKIKGKRAKAKMTDEERKAAYESGKEVREASSSQMSFDNQVGNFSQLIDFLSIQNYIPNEKDLQVESLKTFREELKKKNAAVVDAGTVLFNARATRDMLMYKEETGLVSVAKDTKAYIKGAFGPQSAHFRKVAGLRFRKN